MFSVPNNHRVRSGPMASDDSHGNAGAFRFPVSNNCVAICIAHGGEGTDWEHVSARVEEGFKRKSRIPTWSEMCKIKEKFWGPEDCVVQFHPAKSDYVNNHPHVLHLWRHQKGFPVPPKSLV